MRTIKYVLVLAILTTFAMSCKNDQKPEVKMVDPQTNEPTAKKLDPNATYAKAEFKIDGMTCAMGCAKTIEKKMAKMDGVRSAKVDFKRELAMVEYDESMVTPKSLEDAVAKAGEVYKVKEMHNVKDFTVETPDE